MFKHKSVKILIGIIVFLLLVFIILWAFSFKKYDVNFGLSFSPEYTQSLGLDWKETYNAILTDLKPRYIRLNVPWSKVESDRDVYYFNDIDYLMNEAGSHNVKVILAIGQKIPRWPECYMPEWIGQISEEERKEELLLYIQNIVERYKNNSALEYWQVENEPFIQFKFGECGYFNKKLVGEEVSKVRELDPNKKIIITDSGELSTWHRASKYGDILGTTVYRTVRTPNGFIVRYGLVPPSFYKLRARLWGNSAENFFVSELQAEPWFTGNGPVETPLPIQEQTANIEQLAKNVFYSQYVGASRAYLWGVEWWYWMKTIQNDSRYWEEMKKVLHK